MGEFCITDATIVTLNPDREVIDRGYIKIRDDRIVAMGEGACPEPRAAGSKDIDASGKIVFPGLINTHNHLFQTLTKGLGDDLVLSDWLSRVTFPAACHLQAEDVHAAALHGCVEGIRGGTTTVLDYMYPHPRPGLGDAVVQAFSESGIRGILGRGTINTGDEFGTPKGIMQDVATVEADCVRLIEKYHGSAGGRISVWLAPAAVWLATREMLELTWDLAKTYKTGYTIHISETPFDREASRKLHGQFDAEVLQTLGILGPNVLMVHCVCLTERDIRMARHHDMKVSHNAVSNMYLSSGVAPVPEMTERGITVGLGTDGPASNNSQDMIELLKFTALLHKVHSKDPTIITAEKVLEMATIDGAKALGMEADIGSLEVGKKADLFVYDPMKCGKSIPMHNPVSTLVYSGSRACVDTVLVDGVPLLLEGRLLCADEEAVYRKCQATADGLATRAGIDRKARKWRSRAF